ncbi:MAG: hydrolase [Candidatus Saccharibacteria bacterium]|nr:hydrolase [Candidatus Saccharibacteria bacterium]
MQKIIPQEATLIPEGAKLVFEGVMYDVYQWEQELFDGTTDTFEMLRRADTVMALCIVDDKILVLKDIQPHRGERISFPGGRIDDEDDDVLGAAKREVREETGYSFRNWKLIRVAQPSTKIEWFVYEFIAWDVIDTSEPHLDAGEMITVEEKDFDTVKQLVLTRKGYLGESAEFFENAASTDDLLQTLEFIGDYISRG